jgi:hypothetical protein
MDMDGVALKKETALDIFAQSEILLKMRCCGNCKHYAIDFCHKEAQYDVFGAKHPAFIDCRKNFKYWEFNGGQKSLL